MSAVGIRSDVDEAIDDLNSSGHGVKIDVSLTPNRDRWHYIGGYYFDADLDITDMGYQVVENWAYVGNQNGVKSTDFSEDSPILATDLEFGFAVETNAEFEPAGEVIEFGQRTTFKNASSLG